ncbi:alkaline phosphatase family protein [Nocardioides daphniae]|uniref:Uncharacterized protein n=1 Tax=Nocardioides daphniae TaxID=402297 RepID=A0ABQ1Q6E1_9ACTN|nr:alkaline phosphatase family protein [Nocardioides daphniae]GGD16104.1 hypothetical protein GCM10007231_13860 [Nocardioides daphniae]
MRPRIAVPHSSLTGQLATQLAAMLVAVTLLVAGLLAPTTAHAGTDVAPGGAATPTSVPAPASAPAAAPTARSVLLISVDGLSPAVVAQLGRKRTPALHRLMAQGTSTRNARTEVELTKTLPNHTSMVTGRRITAEQGGHGVWWNDDRRSPATVHKAAGHRVASVFTRVDGAGGSSAVFAGKTKFRLWNRTWGRSIDRFQVRADDARLARDVRRDLRRKNRTLRFWHIAAPDRTGHAKGFSSRAYRRAVRSTDALVGEVLRTIRTSPRLRGKVAVVLTSDHGADGGRRHSDETKLGNQQILFVAQGPGIATGADLYAINPGTVAGPGRRQPAYDADLPPVRNGDAANFVLDLLGLAPVPGSELNADQHLKWVRPAS